MCLGFQVGFNDSLSTLSLPVLRIPYVPKKETPMIALFMSSGQTWTTGELMRLTLSHVVCESLIFSLFSPFSIL